MRLAIIRQRYTPYGGAERFVEAALEALLERSIAITLYTRSWPQTRLQLIEPVICNPPYIGRLWRDRGFARAVCEKISRTPPELVQSHERLLCCDVYRAGDGVHQVYLEERLRDATPLARRIIEWSPYHRYVLDMERRLFASPALRAVICNSKMVREEIRERFAFAETAMHVVYNAVDSDDFSPRLNEHRDVVRKALGVPDGATVFLLVGSGYLRKGVAEEPAYRNAFGKSAAEVEAQAKRHFAAGNFQTTTLSSRPMAESDFPERPVSETPFRGWSVSSPNGVWLGGFPNRVWEPGANTTFSLTLAVPPAAGYKKRSSPLALPPAILQ